MRAKKSPSIGAMVAVGADLGGVAVTRVYLGKLVLASDRETWLFQGAARPVAERGRGILGVQLAAPSAIWPPALTDEQDSE